MRELFNAYCFHTVSAIGSQRRQTLIVVKHLFSNNVIPIVMGAHPDDYARALPPKSYIHVDSFQSPRDLAVYLHQLDRNDVLYNEYFRWKASWTAFGVPYWCRVCGLLHAADVQNYVHWYPEYTRYWDGENGAICSSNWKDMNGFKWLSWS